MSWCFCGMGDVPAILGRKHLSQLLFLQRIAMMGHRNENLNLGDELLLGRKL